MARHSRPTEPRCKRPAYFKWKNRVTNCLSPGFRDYRGISAKPCYDSGDLAIIHGCGLTNGTRSHFEAQDMMERGVADQKSLRTGSGWLTRTLDALKPAGLLPAVAIGGEMPDSLLHSNVAVSMQDTREFGYGQDSQLELLKRFYSGRDGIHRAGRLTLDAITTLQRKLPRDKDGNLSRYTPEAKAI